MTLAEFAALVRGRLVVSCQAPTGHALRDTATQVRLAEAAVAGGAAAIRCGGYGDLPDVAGIARTVGVPVIGLTKDGEDGVYITPTAARAVAVIEAGAQVVATDATGRPRPDGRPLVDTIRAVHERGGLVMADVSVLAEAEAAVAAGADMVSTTLSGYTPYSRQATGADIALIAAIRAALPGILLLGEGRIHSPAVAAEAMSAGADAVVVGTAITDPTWITRSFAAAVATPDSEV